MPLRTWALFYNEVEAQRLRHYARLIGVVHPKNPTRAQRAMLRAAAMIRAGRRGVDLLRDPRALRRRVMGMPGVAVREEKAKSGPRREASADGDDS